MESESKVLSKTEQIALLEKSKLFLGVPQDEIAGLVNGNVGYLATYQKGEILIREGETWNSIDVILKGNVRVNRLFQDGSESTVHMLWETGVIGMEFLVKADYKSQFYYVAETEVITYSFHKWHFTDYRQLGAKVSFQMLKNLINILSHENVRQYRRLDALSARDLRGRLMVYLNYERKKKKSNEFDIPYSREGLATYLCVNRSALSRELGRMEKEGLIQTKGKHFVLIDVENTSG